MKWFGGVFVWMRFFVCVCTYTHIHTNTNNQSFSYTINQSFSHSYTHQLPVVAEHGQGPAIGGAAHQVVLQSDLWGCMGIDRIGSAKKKEGEGERAGMGWTVNQSINQSINQSMRHVGDRSGEIGCLAPAAAALVSSHCDCCYCCLLSSSSLQSVHARLAHNPAGRSQKQQAVLLLLLTFCLSTYIHTYIQTQTFRFRHNNNNAHAPCRPTRGAGRPPTCERGPRPSAPSPPPPPSSVLVCVGVRVWGVAGLGKGAL
jgi:hypothetical protein